MSTDPEKQRAAKRRYYQRNKKVYLDKNKRKIQRLKKYFRESKDVPCADCGKRYPYFVMDFDHREQKEDSIAQLVYFWELETPLG